MASIIWFFIIFSVVVISHEFGHFLIAKANGIHVVEFYVGFGPALFHFTKGGTTYSWRLLPLGGACVFEGMDGLEEENGNEEAAQGAEAASGRLTEETAPEQSGTAVLNAEDLPGTEGERSGSFLKASVWARFATVVAGPVFNLILGFLIAFIMVNMIVIRDPVATEVIEGGAAEAAGIQKGDRIISLNGTRIYLYDDIVLFNALYDGGEVVAVVERDGERITTVLTPQYSSEYGRYLIGISNADFAELSGTDAFRYAWYEMRYNLKMTYGSLGLLLRGRVGREDIAGPVGIAVNVVGETYEQTKQYGWETVLVNMLNIALMLTVNLGILNLLPIPALDGGRLIFVLIEMVRGKPVPPEREAMVHFIGTVFFLVLVVLVFFNDLRNVFGF